MHIIITKKNAILEMDNNLDPRIYAAFPLGGFSSVTEQQICVSVINHVMSRCNDFGGTAQINSNRIKNSYGVVSSE